ncbi:hypothetical protein MMC24_004228 [Lignoscripta atroalba]|nr:hypothetical protein [Lignoscripta atroalba]
MSSDLWKEFAASGDPSDNPWAQATPQAASSQTRIEPGSTVELIGTTTGYDGNDLGHWGDTELLSEHPHSKVAQTWPDNETEKNNVWEDEKSDGILPTTKPSSRLKPRPTTEGSEVAEVLFDATRELETEEDDFGVFEEPDMQSIPASLPVALPNFAADRGPFSVDLLTLKEMTLDSGISTYSQPPESPSLHGNIHFSDLVGLSKDTGPTREERKNAEPSPARPTRTQTTVTPHNDLPAAAWYRNEEWGDFVDSGAPQGNEQFEYSNADPAESCNDGTRTSTLNPTSQNNLAIIKSEDVQTSKFKSAEKITVVPPSNIPPPSILMPLVATLIQKLPAEIREVTQQSSLTESSRQSLKDILGSCFPTIRVGARISAGRKHRWKRDTHLLQSMNIGPAQAGKVGGMKLVGIDKAESRREDGEAAEFVRVWKQHSGSLRAAVAAARTIGAGQTVTIPDITEVMAIRTAKGAVKDQRSCVLCGLNRDERIVKVDTDVEDSFGEWWTDHWGHTECRFFWEEHEQDLRQR